LLNTPVKMKMMPHHDPPYADLPLGFADATVIACAERSGRKVLTLDRRHFGVVAREDTIEVLPT